MKPIDNIAVFMNKLRNQAKWLTAILTLGLVSSLGYTQSDVEDIVITATKRESTLQEAPLAVNAFTGDQLTAKGIDDALDIQFSVPNMLFSKTNFTSSNVAIRGIGNNAVGASSDSGAGIHFNGAYLVSPDIFESEFYDVERVEVLRGPQGTLYGRNTTAGVINVIAKKPVADQYGGEVKIEGTDLSGRKVVSALNFPLIKNFIQARSSFFRYQRDGTILNELTGNLIDDRDVLSYRNSLRIGGQPGGWFEAVYTRQHFEEEDARTRTNKQACHKDLTPGDSNLGCLPGKSLYDEGAFGTPATHITLVGIVGAGLGLNAPVDTSVNCEVFGQSDCSFTYDAATYDISKYDSSLDANVEDIRSFNTEFDPYYFVDSDLETLAIDLKAGDALTLSYVASTNIRDFRSNTDYTQSGALDSYELGGSALGYATYTLDTYVTPNGQGISGFTKSVAVDASYGVSEQNSTEVRLTSGFDGGFNFMFGSFELEYESSGAYEIHSNVLSAYCAYLQAFAGGSCQEEQSYYKNDTQLYRLDSSGSFGELYFEGERLRLTLGFRTTEETKSTTSLQTLLENNKLTYLPGLSGQSSLNDATDYTQGFAGNGNSALDSAVTLSDTWDEPSSKFAIDYLGENSVVFLTVSNSYKSGGLNPPASTGAFLQTFEPEYIDSVEFGVKTSYGINKKNSFNWTLFNYDYQGLQTSKIVDRTSVNENIDATVSGLEVEWTHFIGPVRAALTVSTLATEILEAYSIDTADPAQYWNSYTQNANGSVTLKEGAVDPIYINERNGDASIFIIKNPAYTGDVVFSEDDCGEDIGYGILTCSEIFTSAPHVRVSIDNSTLVGDSTSVYYNSEEKEYYVAPSLDLTDSSATAVANVKIDILDLVQGAENSNGQSYLPAKFLTPIGVATDLSGNSLPNSPETSVNFNLAYLGEIDGNKFSVGVEYYWQDDFYSRVYNTEQDKIESWEVVNFNASISDKNDQWSMNFFIKNSGNDDSVTGSYFTDASSGNFNNLFLLEPRIVGVNFRVSY